MPIAPPESFWALRTVQDAVIRIWVLAANKDLNILFGTTFMWQMFLSHWTEFGKQIYWFGTIRCLGFWNCFSILPMMVSPFGSMVGNLVVNHMFFHHLEWFVMQSVSESYILTTTVWDKFVLLLALHFKTGSTSHIVASPFDTLCTLHIFWLALLLSIVVSRNGFLLKVESSPFRSFRFATFHCSVCKLCEDFQLLQFFSRSHCQS